MLIENQKELLSKVVVREAYGEYYVEVPAELFPEIGKVFGVIYKESYVDKKLQTHYKERIAKVLQSEGLVKEGRIMLHSRWSPKQTYSKFDFKIAPPELESMLSVIDALVELD